ncbi:PIN-like domain-containing protein [Bacillus thuringiensis]|nr:PIN-like domain-containing protein [Bacillus thuringiensis]
MQNEFDKLFIETKSVDRMVKKAKIVIDTNVLLSAYQTKTVTFDVMFEVLQELADSGRLIIPSHVMWEFSKNRPNRIKEIANNLHQHVDGLEKNINVQKPKELTSILPAIDVLEETHISEILKLQQEFKEKIKELQQKGRDFQKGLKELAIKMGDYIDNDPILLKYKGILSKSKVEVDIQMKDEELEKEGTRRAKAKIPPGFKDSEKDFNKYGDLIIWLEMCQLKEDIIFITFDNKPDWVYKDSKDNVLAARRELVLEYYEKSGGKTFKIVHPGKFVELYREGRVPKEVTEELKEVKVNYVDSIASDMYGDAETRQKIINFLRKGEINNEKEVLLERIYILEKKVRNTILKIKNFILLDEEEEKFNKLIHEFDKLSIFTVVEQNSVSENIEYERKLARILNSLQTLYIKVAGN